jgi:hypothetical protein
MTTQNFLHKGEVLAFFVNWLTFLAPVIGEHIRHTGRGSCHNGVAETPSAISQTSVSALPTRSET